MALNKDKLIFDETAVDQSDQVGAHILGSSDNKITSHTVASDEGLDVYLLNTSIEVTATDLDIRDLQFATDSVDVSGSSVSITGDVNVTQGTSPWVIGDGGGSITIDASDLDIRDITHVSDSIRIGDGTDFLAVNADGSINVNADISVVNGHEKLEDAAHASGDVGSFMLAVRQDSLASSVDTDGDYAALKVDSLGQLYTRASVSSNVADDAADTENPIKVGSRAVDGLLPAISASGDKANLISDMYRRLFINSSPNVGFNVADADVTNTASEIASSPLSGRMKIEVQNLGNRAIYLGHSNAVTTANGYRIAAGATGVFEFGEDLDLWAITDSGTQDIRILQLA